MIRCVDNVLVEFGLEKYYENPDPHVSVAYALCGESPAPTSPVSSVTDLGSLGLAEEDLEKFRIDFDSISIKIGKDIHLVSSRN